jgi:Tol biopolymer transport system component
MRRAEFGTVVGLLLMVMAFPGSARATYPGPNGQVAYWRQHEGLFVANPDGSHEGRIVKASEDVICPEWSPDSSRLAFTYIDDEGVQVATAAPDGSDFQLLTHGAHISECASWSPDGNRFVYDYAADPEAPGFSTALYTMNAHDGSQALPLLAPGDGGFDVEPRWQPTGKLITFVRIRKCCSGIQQEAVFRVRADGTHPMQLTPYGMAAEHPTWSPDGRWIVFNDGSSSAGTHETIWIMRADGADRHVLYQGTRHTGGVKPQISPDGTRVLFMCVRYGTAFGNVVSEDICTMNMDGTDVVNITNTPDVKENWPAWGSAPLT